MTMARPPMTTRLVPNRSTIFGACGPMSIIPAAIGVMRTPVFSGL